MRRAVAAALLGLAQLAQAAPDGTWTEAEVQARLMRGWAALRAADCARCHGRDYGGWSAPDLVAAVREGSRERFDRIVLDGEIVRGMPGYKGQDFVVSALDAMYGYLRARADGAVAAGPLIRPPLPPDR